MPENLKISAPDLTQRPPRSPRCRLGGYVILPRMLDKGRATIAGKNGEFNYDAPFDQHIINFLGLDPAALLEQLAAGKGDGEILEWIGEKRSIGRRRGKLSNGANTCFAGHRTATRRL